MQEPAAFVSPQSGPYSSIPPEPSESLPQPTGELRSVIGFGRAAIVLIWLPVVADLGFYLAARNTHDVVRDYQAGTAQMGDLGRADEITGSIAIASVALLVLTALVFLIWLWRARVNSELLCQARHARSRGWVWGGWICPVVNLWFPFQVVRDVWKASHPDAAPEGYNMHNMPFTKVVGWWWVFFLLDNVIDYYIFVKESSEITTEVLDAIVTAEAMSTVVSAIAAILITCLVVQISRWQQSRLPAMA